LNARYYFLCDCAHCADVESDDKTLNAMQCNTAGCEGAIPFPNKVCALFKSKVEIHRVFLLSTMVESV
jgi:hypothetical protein